MTEHYISVIKKILSIIIKILLLNQLSQSILVTQVALLYF